MRDRIIISLFDRSGAWSAPYLAAGYDVRRVCLPESDVLTYEPPPRVHGILAAPPCTEFAVSGARWWSGKPPERLAEALALVDRTLAIIAATRPAWHAIENPIGRLRRLRPVLGAPRLTFDPCDYATCDAERYTKRTQVFGAFDPPPKHRQEPLGSRPGMPNEWYSRVGGKSQRTKDYRSMTPPGFAEAFFRSNP